ncbi:hypothetical protein F5I97DRAFT_2005299 [Phlebopus sp. FC_14]|nr:hypothetical protein F5I97DRAFT_2005299 [Phlebopus sp. FC_14]
MSMVRITPFLSEMLAQPWIRLPSFGEEFANIAIHGLTNFFCRIIDTAQTFLIVAGAYVYLIEQFGNWTFFFEIVSPFWIQIILGTIAESIVQGFFVYRLYTFSEEKLWIVPLPAALYGLVAAFRGMNALSAIYACNPYSFSIMAKQVDIVLHPVMRGLGISYLAVSAVIDIFIAVSFTILLWKQKQYTRTRSSVKMVQRLIMFSIVSGMWTAVFAVCDIATYLGIQGTSIWVVFDMPICSLYCNTLLANLNGRTYIAGKSTIISTGINLSTFHGDGGVEDSTDAVAEVHASSTIL